MKRMLSLLLVAAFVLSLTVCGSAASASAQTVTTTSTRAVTPTFAVDDAIAVRGNEFTVAVRVINNPGIVSCKLLLQYDTNRFELVSAEGQDFADVIFAPATKVPFIINWVDAIHPDNTTDGVIANVTFRVKADAAIGSTTFSLSYDPEDVYNAAWENVTFATQTGVITVTDLLLGDVNNDQRVNNRDLGLLQQYLTGWDVTVNVAAADVTADDKVNNRDLGLIQQYLTGWDVEFVYPDVPDTPDTPDTPDDGDVLEQIPSSLSGQKIKMMIWWMASVDDTNRATFFKEQTGIQVAFETSTLDKYQTNLAGKVMAGNPPHTAAIINEWYPQPITRGLMQPIKNTGWDYTDDIYATSLMDQFSYKGEHYGVALKGSAFSTFEVMFFNRDMLKNKGIAKDPYELWKEGNWNWDTCLDIAMKCTDAQQGKYGLTLIAQWYWMLSAGQDFVLSDKNGLVNNIQSSKLLDTWYFAWDTIYVHKVVDTSFTGQQAFYQQRAAMFGGGSYFMQADANYSSYVPQNCDFDWGVVPFPSPKGQAAVTGCEGTVWGFPVRVTGDKLQAAMWWLRYYLDDAHYTDRDFYPNEQCWEVLDWMWEQPIQSYNSVGVLCYGGKYTAWTIQYDVIDCAATRAQVKTNLDAWYGEIEANIDAIENEF